ncbi:FAD-dependent oxidoreductase [Streptacidiphilus fuscans]
MARNLRVDAVVVGAGLAGPACSADLCAAGLNVMLVEASHRAGGRMVSDYRDGFVLDRGSQVFNTAYPQVRRRVRLDHRATASVQGALASGARAASEVLRDLSGPRAARTAVCTWTGPAARST